MRGVRGVAWAVRWVRYLGGKSKGNGGAGSHFGPAGAWLAVCAARMRAIETCGDVVLVGHCYVRDINGINLSIGFRNFP